LNRLDQKQQKYATDIQTGERPDLVLTWGAEDRLSLNRLKNL
jgi:hypothetical protein